MQRPFLLLSSAKAPPTSHRVAICTSQLPTNAPSTHSVAHPTATISPSGRPLSHIPACMSALRFLGCQFLQMFRILAVFFLGNFLPRSLATAILSLLFL